MNLEIENQKLKEENQRLKERLELYKSKKITHNNVDDITTLINIEELKTLFEQFSDLTGYTVGFVKQDTREVLISTGWTDICKQYHRGSSSSEHICQESNKALTENLRILKETSFQECQHGMIDGATPIIINDQHIADLFSGQVLFEKPDIEKFKLGAKEYGYDIKGYLKALDDVKILSKEKLKKVLSFLSNIANLIAKLGTEKQKFLELNTLLEEKIIEKTKHLESVNSNLHDYIDNFQELFNLTQEALVISDEQFNIIDMNISAQKMFGDTNDSFVGKNLIEYVPSYEIPKVQEALQKNLVEPYELDLYRNDRTIFPALAGGEFISRNGKKERLTTVLDLSNLKEKEKQLLVHEKQIALNDMLNNIAHQWRQPLSVIASTATSMSLFKSMDKLSDEKFESSCELINKQAQFISSMIDSFKNLTEDDNYPSVFRFENIFQEFLHIIQGQLDEHEIKMVYTIKPIELLSYPKRFLQSLIYLFNNAKEAFEKNEIMLKYVFIDIDSDDENIIIQFKDNALGIDEEIIKKIFEPYFTTKHQSIGTGLGLHIVYDYVSKMGGTISAKNTQYEYENYRFDGALFTIRLPLNILEK